MKHKEAIKQIQEGKIQVYNDLLPSTKEIKKFLKEAFPEDEIEENNTYILNEFFRKDSVCYGLWFSSNNNFNLPVINLSTITKRKKAKLSQLEKQFSELAKDVVELRQTIAKDVEVDVKEVKSELIVGEWYKNEKYGYIFCFNGKYKDFSQYGFNINNEWKTEISSHKRHVNFIIKATPKEVQTSLENEAKKRGFKNGAIINNSSIGFCFNELYLDTNLFEWNGTYLNIGEEKLAIFKDGIWAELIQQETIKEDKIDFSVPQLLIYKQDESFILMTNGIYTTDKFEAHVILDKKGKSGWEIGSFSDKWEKECYKLFKGELTIK